MNKGTETVKLDFTWKQVAAFCFLCGSTWATIGINMNQTSVNTATLKERAPYIQKVDNLANQGALTRDDVKQLNATMVQLTIGVNSLVTQLSSNETATHEIKGDLKEVKNRLREIEIKVN